MAQDIIVQLLSLQGKHIFTEDLGDGEVNNITFKDHSRTGCFVYFHSNLHGEVKLDGEEFLKMVIPNERCRCCETPVITSDICGDCNRPDYIG
ncbi:hypothetical protein ABHN11_24605 [Brevibacillus centrosporus]|uniref:hypothetical protein n=1 Tax=Brevibacillus centrosporus TaxID=54910 RepID=UPI003D214FC0